MEWRVFYWTKIKSWHLNICCISVSSIKFSTNSLSAPAPVLPVTTNHILRTDTTASPLNSILPMNTSSANQISTSTHIPSVTTPAASQSTPGGLFTSGQPLLTCSHSTFYVTGDSVCVCVSNEKKQFVKLTFSFRIHQISSL